MNGTHRDMTISMAVDGETLALLVRYSTETGRPVQAPLADAVRLYKPTWQAGSATAVDLSHRQPVEVRESTPAEIAQTAAEMAETMAALLGLPA